MNPIKLNVKTKSENYPIIIGSNIIKNLALYLKKNSINFNQCLLVIDKNVPRKMILKIILFGTFLSIIKRHWLKLIENFLRYLDKSLIIFEPIIIGYFSELVLITSLMGFINF